MTLAGIDVSAIGQGTAFNWGAYRGRIQFAFAKATEGITFTDPAFTGNYAQMRALGIVPGAYHFLRPADPADAQAHHFLSVARPQPGDLMMVDVEVADGCTVAQVAQCAHDFAMAIRVATNAWPFVYTDISMARGGYVSACSSCPSWIANPSAGPITLPIGPWHVLSIEQTGQRGVDTDVFYGDAAQLAALAVPPPAPAGPSKAQALAALATLTKFVQVQ